MRITGGELSGRRLRAPRGAVRPTADRVREALFARLGPLAGARVLDLFAGSGALGIEALSRGAGGAVFVDRSASAVAQVRANLRALGLETRARVWHLDALRAVERLASAGERFELVFVDPPYASDLARRALERLAEAGLLAPDGLVVVEEDRRHPPAEVPGLVRVDERRYGDTRVSRHAPREPGPRGERPQPGTDARSPERP